jgi:phage host-nuclease inhibitor protein Gam
MKNRKNTKALATAGHPPENLIPAIFSRADLEARVAELALLKLEEAQVAAGLDADLQAARERHEPRLASLRKRLAALTAAAQTWADANRAEFGRLRSLELRAGTLGWRAGQPTLKPRPGWTWERVLAQLKSLAGLAGYVRLREEVNRQRLLADRVALGEERLGEIGVQLAQEDNFFVEPRLEVTNVNAREKLAA